MSDILSIHKMHSSADSIPSHTTDELIGLHLWSERLAKSYRKLLLAYLRKLVWQKLFEPSRKTDPTLKTVKEPVKSNAHDSKKSELKRGHALVYSLTQIKVKRRISLWRHLTSTFHPSTQGLAQLIAICDPYKMVPISAHDWVGLILTPSHRWTFYTQNLHAGGA